MKRHRLLISGVPAAGKSHLGRWLASTHGYVHVDVENPECVGALGLSDVVAPFIYDGTTEGLLDALEVINKPLLFDWGFPPRCLYVVEEFEECGFQLWWLDAEPTQARRQFIQRGTVDVKYFDIQMAAIKKKWRDIEELFRPRILGVLDAAGHRLTPEEIWQHIEHAA